jgi:hypothetical protein
MQVAQYCAVISRETKFAGSPGGFPCWRFKILVFSLVRPLLKSYHKFVVRICWAKLSSSQPRLRRLVFAELLVKITRSASHTIRYVCDEPLAPQTSNTNETDHCGVVDGHGRLFAEIADCCDVDGALTAQIVACAKQLIMNAQAKFQLSDDRMSLNCHS